MIELPTGRELSHDLGSLSGLSDYGQFSGVVRVTLDDQLGFVIVRDGYQVGAVASNDDQSWLGRLALAHIESWKGASLAMAEYSLDQFELVIQAMPESIWDEARLAGLDLVPRSRFELENLDVDSCANDLMQLEGVEDVIIFNEGMVMASRGARDAEDIAAIVEDLVSSQRELLSELDLGKVSETVLGGVDFTAMVLSFKDIGVSLFFPAKMDISPLRVQVYRLLHRHSKAPQTDDDSSFELPALGDPVKTQTGGLEVLETLEDLHDLSFNGFITGGITLRNGAPANVVLGIKNGVPALAAYTDESQRVGEQALLPVCQILNHPQSEIEVHGYPTIDLIVHYHPAARIKLSELTEALTAPQVTQEPDQVNEKLVEIYHFETQLQSMEDQLEASTIDTTGPAEVAQPAVMDDSAAAAELTRLQAELDAEKNRVKELESTMQESSGDDAGEAEALREQLQSVKDSSRVYTEKLEKEAAEARKKIDRLSKQVEEGGGADAERLRAEVSRLQGELASGESPPTSTGLAALEARVAALESTKGSSSGDSPGLFTEFDDAALKVNVFITRLEGWRKQGYSVRRLDHVINDHLKMLDEDFSSVESDMEKMGRVNRLLSNLPQSLRTEDMNTILLINQWKSNYLMMDEITERLDDYLKTLEEEFNSFESDVGRLQRFEEMLELIDIEGFEQEINAIRKRLKDPEQVLQVEYEFIEVGERVKEEMERREAALGVSTEAPEAVLAPMEEGVERRDKWLEDQAKVRADLMNLAKSDAVVAPGDGEGVQKTPTIEGGADLDELKKLEDEIKMLENEINNLD